MQVDTRPYRAGYSQAFLSRKFHEKIATKRQIAKAVIAGCSPKELSDEYGISVQKVMAIASWYDRERMLAKKLARVTVHEEPTLASPEPVAGDEPAPGTYWVTVIDASSIGARREQRVTLPLLSIQRGEA